MVDRPLFGQKGSRQSLSPEAMTAYNVMGFNAFQFTLMRFYFKKGFIRCILYYLLGCTARRPFRPSPMIFCTQWESDWLMDFCLFRALQHKRTHQITTYRQKLVDRTDSTVERIKRNCEKSIVRKLTSTCSCKRPKLKIVVYYKEDRTFFNLG